MKSVLKSVSFLSVIWMTLAVSFSAFAKNHCMDCHKGIERIVPPKTTMGRMLKAMGGEHGTCVVCHKGNPDAKDKAMAHGNNGKSDFYPDPGSPWVSDKTCGQCHEGYTQRVRTSLMDTEAGKIQGALHTVGVQQDKRVIYGDYDVSSATEYAGSKRYLAYMERLTKAYPDEFPKHLKQLPATDMKRLKKHPNEYTFNYLRGECLACHVGVKGRSRRGDYRGMGCSSCHVPYADNGLSKTKDPTVPGNKPGHMLVHKILGTRAFGGPIPTKNCLHCHTRGKRIGVSFTGIMESPYPTPFGPGGHGQKKIHGKFYQHIQADVHYEAGLTCQDCHTSIDMHGDGRIFGTTLAQVEIECTDCHGTTRAYPWELPIGFMDEFGLKGQNKPRGLENGDSGHLYTARGNLFNNVERLADKSVVLHAADGKDHLVPLLKDMKQQGKLNENALTAMDKVGLHVKKMECYACHSSWAPQCYGCHVSYNAKGHEHDWLKIGNKHNNQGVTPDRAFIDKLPSVQGKIRESRSYLRWERPILGVNGEGRITPLEPGCQVISTVVGPDGKTLVQSKIWKSEGIPGIDMAPAFPHTIDKHARSCESCHSDPKTAGYGIENGRFFRNYNRNTSLGQGKDNRGEVQFWGIKGLWHDLSQIITKKGKQLQTVGSHWPLSRPLSNQERAVLMRTGACLACHSKKGRPEFDKMGKKGLFTTKQHNRNLQRILKKASERTGCTK